MCAPTTTTTALVDKKDQRQSDTSPEAMQQTPPMVTSRISIVPRQPLDMTPIRVVVPNATPTDVTNASRIRSRFLHRLGIEKAPSQTLSAGKQPHCKVGLVNAKYRPQPPSRTRCHAPNASLSATISDSPLSTTCFNSTSASKDRRNRAVTFQDEVTTYLIPTRYEYSERVRGQLWSSPEELQRNAVRNAVEFASEGWDWRKVVLDHDMIRNFLTGELIHPVHFYIKREFNLHQHFVHVMAARAGYYAPDASSRKSRPLRAQPSCVAISQM